jgi:hypothetical protein
MERAAYVVPRQSAGDALEEDACFGHDLQAFELDGACLVLAGRPRVREEEVVHLAGRQRQDGRLSGRTQSCQVDADLLPAREDADREEQEDADAAACRPADHHPRGELPQLRQRRRLGHVDAYLDGGHVVLHAVRIEPAGMRDQRVPASHELNPR